MKDTYTRECCIVWRLLYVQYTQGMNLQLGSLYLATLSTEKLSGLPQLHYS